MGGVGNGAAEEDWRWDLNLGSAAIPGRGPRSFGAVNREDHAVLKEKGEDHGVLRGEGRENHAALAEWGPRGGHTGNGARSLNHRLLLLFLRYGNPDWAEGEGSTVCVCGYSKGL